MDDFDRFVERLQEEIFEEARQAYGQKGFERWRNPRFQGRMASADTYARVTGDCGDTMEIYLKIENNRIKEASYFTDGCASSNICGSFAAELALGKDPDDLADINGDSLLSAVGLLPEEDHHCAHLAAATLQEALHRYMTDSRQSRHSERPVSKKG
ncbi:MAG: iron-sulfur cluster assembly scaffold protein [Desulfosalsimonas sp.]